MDSRHSRQNFDPRHPRHCFLTHTKILQIDAPHAPTPPMPKFDSRHSRTHASTLPRYLADSYNNSGHQTWQEGNMQWRAPTHEISTWAFNHVVLWDHVTY